MYNSLLLSTGGGIISNIQKTLQAEDPVVIIGIGGTGARVVDSLKKKVYKQLQPDNPDSTVPKYEHIQFLEIDSDSEWQKNTVISDSEFLNLKDPDIKVKFTSESKREKMIEQPQFSWLEAENIDIPNTIEGAGAVRQIGRYLIINSSKIVKQKIESIISNAVKDHIAKNLVVHIVAGISGGMGSGCFIDTCYIVRKVLADNGWDAAAIFGYFFLPDVITTIPEIKSKTEKVDVNYRNGYAALKELDYLMSLKENLGHFCQDYKSFSIDTNQTPVDMCHLVSAIDAKGNIRADGFNYCINVVSDYIMSYLAKPENDNTITPKGNLTNIDSDINELKITKGAYNRYHVLGASNAEMPMAKIATYLATELYSKMTQYLKHDLGDQDVVDFANKMKLTVADLKGATMLARDVKMNREVPKPQMETIKNITASHVHSEHILRPMNDWLAEQEGVLERNYKGLVSDVQMNYKRNEEATSLIGILFNELYDLAVDSNYGPYYAASLLSRTGKDLKTVLEGLHKEVSNLIKDAENSADFQSGQVEEAKQTFTSSKNGKVMNRHVEEEAYDAYLGAIGIWYRRLLDVEFYKYMDKVVLAFQKQVEDMYTQYFDILVNVLDNLNETFEENSKYFAGGHADDLADDGYTLQIMKFSDVKPQLDSVMMQEQPSDAMSSLLTYLLSNADEWLSQEEYRIGKLINSFMYDHYKDQLTKSIQKYLDDKWPALAPDQRVEKIKDEIFEPLMKASEPLIWKSAHIAIDDIHPTITLSYPTSSIDISTAAENFKKKHAETTLRGTEIKDRLFMLRLYSGMPLYGYHALDQIKKVYDDKSDIAGVHLYGTSKEDWRNLPTPIPYSLDSKQVENGEAVEKAYNRAKELGLIEVHLNSNENNSDKSKNKKTILRVPDVKDKNVIELMEDLRCFGENAEADKNKIEHYEIIVKQVQEKYMFQDGIFSAALANDWEQRVQKLQNDIKMGTYTSISVSNYGSEVVGLDYLMKSPKMVEKLVYVVALYDATELVCERLQEFMDDIEIEEKDIVEFSNALFGGIFQIGIGKIFYTYVDRHTEREIILANKTMTFGSFLYYQAYVTFKGLEENIKKDIIDQTSEKMNNLQEGDDAIALKIKEKCTPKDMAYLEKQYSRLKEKDDIKIFYDKFLDLMYDFTGQFI